MSDDATIPNDFPAAAPASMPAPHPTHAEHGWLSWLIIALGVVAAVGMIALGVRIVFGHHMMAVAAMRHGYLRAMPFRRGPLRPFAPRGWRR